MRIWDVAPRLLCRKHLTGEHRELHGLWNILSQDKHGYAHHPETRRWRGKLAALYARHEALAAEMVRRGYIHASPLDPALAVGAAAQEQFVDPPREQLRLLGAKPCPCPLAAAGAEGTASERSPAVAGAGAAQKPERRTLP